MYRLDDAIYCGRRVARAEALQASPIRRAVDRTARAEIILPARRHRYVLRAARRLAGRVRRRGCRRRP